MPSTAEATVIDHPTFQAAQQAARRRKQAVLDAMKRHPSYLARQLSDEVATADR